MEQTPERPATDTIVLLGLDQETYESQLYFFDDAYHRFPERDPDLLRRYIEYLWQLTAAYRVIELLFEPPTRISATTYEFTEAGWPVYNIPEPIDEIIPILRRHRASGALVICRVDELSDFERRLAGLVQTVVVIDIRKDPQYSRITLEDAGR